MGPAAAYLVPAGAGLLGSLIGGNQQSHAADAAQASADQSAAAQQKINQQMMDIYNSLFQSYQSNYQPLQGPLSGQMSSLLGAGAGTSANIGTYLQNLMNPGSVDKQTGIPTQQAGQDAFSYFAQPGATQSQQAGGQALDYFMRPNDTNLAQQLPGILNTQQGAIGSMGQAAGAAGAGLPFLTNPGQSAVAQQAPTTLNYLNNTGGTNLAGVTPELLSYLGNPGGTNLSGATPDAMALFQRTAQQGLDPNVISQALGQNDVAAQRAISDVQNRAGGIPNLAGTIKDITGQEFASNADLLSKLGAQSQGLKLQGAQAGLGAASGLDSQMLQMLSALQPAAGNLDTQTQGMLGQALQAAGYTTDQIAGLFGQATSTGGTLANIAGQQAGTAAQMGQTAGSADQQKANLLGLGVNTAGGLDQQTAQYLMQALGIGQQSSQTALGNQGTATQLGMSIPQLIQSFITSGNPLVGGATAGMQNIAGQYGAAGAQAGQNLSQINSQNPFASFANSLSSIKWPTATATSTVAPVATAPSTGSPYQPPASYQMSQQYPIGMQP